MNIKFGIKRKLFSRILFSANDYLQNIFIREGLPTLACIPRDYLGKKILMDGLFEYEPLLLIEKVLKKELFSKRNRKRVFFDVGANIGNHTCFLAKNFDLVVSIEPSPIIVEILRANIAINQLKEKVRVEDVALSNLSRSGNHYTVQNGNLGGSSLDPKRVDLKESIISEIRFVRGDDMVSKHLKQDDHLSVLKIDVEGHELEVIEGFAESIQQHKPLIIFETDNKNTFNLIKDNLGKYNYKDYYEIVINGDLGIIKKIFRLISGSKFVKLNKIKKIEDRYYENILAVADNKLAQHNEEC